MDIKFASRFPRLTTNRLDLREVTASDAEFIHFMRNDSKVNEFVDRPKTESVSDAASFIEQRHQDLFYKRAVYWGIELKTNSFLVGTITLWNMDLKEGYAELGFDLHPSFQGRGLMHEAVEEVLNFGFNLLLLSKITAITSPQNLGSQKVLQKHEFESLSKDALSEIDQEAGLIGFIKYKAKDT